MNRFIPACLLVAAVSLGCRSHHHHHDATASAEASASVSTPRHMMANTDLKSAVTVLHGTKGNEGVMGTVKFTQAEGGLQVMAHITGLAPNSKHGFHIHEFGDCSAPDAASAGSHYDPAGTKHHGEPTADPAHRHAGDMGNLTADETGMAHLELTLKNVSINGENAILGRGVIVHEKPDDFGQPVGNAGARIACGVIGVAK